MEIELILDTVAVSVIGNVRPARTASQKLRLWGDFVLDRNLAALISLAVVISGALTLSTQSAEAKNARKKTRIAGNYFVPPPPPYTPSLVPVALGMTYAPALGEDGDYAALEMPVNPYSKYILKRNSVDKPQVVRPNPYLSYDRGVETKVQKSIDDIDSEISNIQKDIGKLLNL